MISDSMATMLYCTCLLSTEWLLPKEAPTPTAFLWPQDEPMIVPRDKPTCATQG
jgi:hypothetical protein